MRPLGNAPADVKGIIQLDHMHILKSKGIAATNGSADIPRIKKIFHDHCQMPSALCQNHLHPSKTLGRNVFNQLLKGKVFHLLSF
jgi:hypothetical protein